MEDKDRENRIQERTIYYRNKIEDYLRPFPIDFGSFIGDKKAIEFGDKLISSHLSTGYNFVPEGKFPVDNSESLIMYGIYCQRQNHVARVISEMEYLGIIEEEDVNFGMRASKIKAGYDDPEPVRKELIMDDGATEWTMKSVDLVLIFSPKSAEQAVNITIFLRNEAPKIPEGYIDPDLRATSTDLLKEVLTEQNLLRIAVANVYRVDNGNMIVLKQRDKFFNKGWKVFDNLLHPKLYEYLVGSGVKP